MKINLNDPKYHIDIDLQHDCPQNHATLVKFDSKLAKNLTPAEVRQRWPRVKCSVCQTFVYASVNSDGGIAHMMAGDW